jgi:D-tyrosyl-tRNA(Tyr) deacylase
LIAVLQKTKEASVTIDGTISGKINKGILILLGIEDADEQEDIDWLVRKIINMRIFEDEEGKMNLSCQDIDGDYLVVSQFTLHASIKKGNRPSFIKAAKPEIAVPLYEQFIQCLGHESGRKIQTGEFGAMMDVALINDGPVTILIDTKNKV